MTEKLIIDFLNKTRSDQLEWEELFEQKRVINFWKRHIKKVDKFDEAQIREIRRGFESGLTIKQIEFYAKPKFKVEQMSVLRHFFEFTVTAEEAKICNECFDPSQMTEILQGIYDGLTLEQVKVY